MCCQAAPASANLRAIALPMPDAAPVINAVFPLKEIRSAKDLSFFD